MERGEFLRLASKTVAGALLYDKVKNLNPEIVDSDFPKPEQVPELLSSYTRNFHSWPEMIQDQKDRLMKFYDSTVCRNALKKDLIEYFPEKGEAEIQTLVDELVQDKIQYVDSIKIKYKDMLKKGLLGHYTPGKDRIELDTIQLEPHTREFKKHKNYTRERADIFVPVHEFYHGSQVVSLTLARTYENILNTLVSSGEITKEDADSAMGSLEILDNGRIKKLPEKDKLFVQNHVLRPTEIIPFIMEIRMAMHIVSENNKSPNVPKYHMYSDEFNQEHLVFIRDNQAKIFSNVSFPDKGPYNINFLKILLANVVAEDMLYLINKCI